MLFKWWLFSATTFSNIRSFVRWNWPDTHVSWITRRLAWDVFYTCIYAGLYTHLINKGHSVLCFVCCLCFWTNIVLCFVLKKYGDLLYSYSPYLQVINITSSGVAADEGKGLQSGGLVTQTIIQTGSVLILSMTPHRLLSDSLRKWETDSGMPALVGIHHNSRAGASQWLNKQICWMFSLYLFVFHRNSLPYSNNWYHFTVIPLFYTLTIDELHCCMHSTGLSGNVKTGLVKLVNIINK